MDVLLTFVGNRDPRWRPPNAQEDVMGPILSLAEIRTFNRIFLFSNFGTATEANATKEALTSRYPGTEAEIKEIPLKDPTDYGAIILGLREYLPQITADIPDANYFVFASPGTPQMQASLMLLVMSGFLDAKFLQLPDPRFGGPLRVLDFSSDGFPEVRVWFREEEIKGIDEDRLLSRAQAARMIGSAPAFRGLLKTAALFAEYDMPVLLHGESGSGKEHVAQFIHIMSKRYDKPFLVFNCSAVTETLAEDTLFGHVRGAFQGAKSDRPGLFAAADGGILFLDEIADTPLTIQPKLLRAVGKGTFTPLGTDKESKVDVRIVSATHRNLKEMVKQGKFRKDLFYRLGHAVEVPPLRRRMEDVAALARHFVTRFNEAHNKKVRITPSAIKRLHQYSWNENNVRELEQVVEEACVMAASKGVVDAHDLTMPSLDSSQDLSTFLQDPYRGFSLPDFVKRIQVHYYRKALEMSGGDNQSEAARLLGVSSNAVSQFLKNHPECFNQS